MENNTLKNKTGLITDKQSLFKGMKGTVIDESKRGSRSLTVEVNDGGKKRKIIVNRNGFKPDPEKVKAPKKIAQEGIASLQKKINELDKQVEDLDKQITELEEKKSAVVDQIVKIESKIMLDSIDNWKGAKKPVQNPNTANA